jgi:hypothetical protein
VAEGDISVCGGGERGLVFSCLEIVCLEKACLGCPGTERLPAARPQVLGTFHSASKKLRSGEVVTCLWPHFERSGSPRRQASSDCSQEVILEA